MPFMTPSTDTLDSDFRFDAESRFALSGCRAEKSRECQATNCFDSIFNEQV